MQRLGWLPRGMISVHKVESDLAVWIVYPSVSSFRSFPGGAQTTTS